MVASEPLWLALRVPVFGPHCSQYVCLHSNMLAIAILSRVFKLKDNIGLPDIGSEIFSLGKFSIFSSSSRPSIIDDKHEFSYYTGSYLGITKYMQLK